MADIIDITQQPEGPVQPVQPIGKEQVRNAYEVLRKYKQGKQRLEDKITRNEKWWKMRHWDLMQTEETMDDPKPASGWLFYDVISKHADFMDSFPDSDILPREPGDVEEAQRLSSIIPVVMDQIGYRKVYSDEVWYKLKNGTGCFGVYWDQSKLNGLGDISIENVDLLSIFWEPGIKDIQKSKNIFTVELVDNDTLKQAYPQVAEQLSASSDTILKKYMYDETIDTTGKTAVIDWYYKKPVNGKMTLQYCKFVGDTVLYATENDVTPPTELQEQPVFDENGNALLDPQTGLPVTQVVNVVTGPSMAERGLYDHGKYPFVFDVLFPEAGMPVGFGFIDVGKNAQASIDIFNNAFEKNVQHVCSPRYLVRNDGGVNEEEFADPNKLIVHVDRNMGQDSIQPINVPTMVNSNYISILENKINEMKETTGNRDSTNGGTQSGVTAAAAIAAMQESAGKTSRDQINTTFDAHKEVVTMVIELIRQFYSMPRQFRITGKQGEQEFVQYSNAGLQPQDQGTEFGIDMGYRVPAFDVKVGAEKSSSYSRLAQNELAMQFYNAGFFNPQYADQVSACLEMMDFQGKQSVLQKVQQNGGMYQQMLQMQQQMLQLSEMIDQLSGGQYNMAGQMSDQINQNLNAQEGTPHGTTKMPTSTADESAITKNAREQTAQTTNPS
uniref:Portal protein n=1 Tax=Myoviridae sp. ctiBE32 TaxID=2826685 RepID=A0A8S5N743_9CAUD|nr:MAG TPA: portal protein [Myoviridae sp. ctiBE32]